MRIDQRVFPFYLAAIYVVVELLSSIFNPFFMEFNIAGRICKFNGSVAFFCMGFFIVDIVFDLYGAKLASHFFNIKVFSLLAFVGLGETFLHMFDIKNEAFESIFNESGLVLLYGLFAYFISYKIMGKTMDSLKKSSISNSVFWRYFLTTVPSEIVFSLIFTALSFSKSNTLVELLGIFLTSSLIKVVLSLIFSLVVTILFYVRIIRDGSFDKQGLDVTAS